MNGNSPDPVADTYQAITDAITTDILNEATRAYWMRRARTFDAVGNTLCDEIAQACRARATLGWGPDE